MVKKLIFVNLLISIYWLPLIFSRETDLFTSIFLFSAWLFLICGFLNKSKGFYGNSVAAPVFKKVAQKIITGIPIEIEISKKDIGILF